MLTQCLSFLHTFSNAITFFQSISELRNFSIDETADFSVTEDRRQIFEGGSAIPDMVKHISIKSPTSRHLPIGT